MASIHLRPSDVLRQASVVLASTDEDTLPFQRHTTVPDAVAAVANIIQHSPRTPVLLTKPRTKQHVAAMKKLALESRENTPPPRMVYRAPPGRAPAAPPPSKKAREAVRRLALQDNGNFDPYVLSVHPQLAEGHLPCLTGCVFTIRGLDGDESSLVCEVAPDNVYFDTCSHRTYITADILPNEFQAYLGDVEHDPYRLANNTKVQVDGTIRFSNSDVDLSFPGIVVPPHSLPNNLSGVLLGQHGMINRLSYEAIPKLILDKLGRGEGLDGTVWGELRIISALRVEDDELQSF